MSRQGEFRLARRSWRGRASLNVLGTVTVMLTVLLLAVPTTALAAEDKDDDEPRGQARPDFRFGAPTTSLGVRGGWTFNRAESDIYQFISDELTVEKKDFNAPTLAMELNWRLSERVDAVFGVEYSRSTTQSEFRDFVDFDDLPIVQETRVTQVPLTVGLKLYLASRGRSVGQFAWVPSDFVPYVGGGGGFTWYRLEQAGDFVDFTDLTIFTDLFRSDGWGASAHAFGGVEIKLSPTLGLVLEGRYQWANADLRESFIGFDPIDLNGLRTTVGVNWKL